MTLSISQQQFLRKFPNRRPALTDNYKKIYIDEILINRGDKGGWFYKLLGHLEGWMHRQVSQPDRSARILEIGAGTLNHVEQEPSATVYDIVEPTQELFEHSPVKHKIRTRYGDISELPDTVTYDRIVTIAAMEHVEDLPYCIARSALALDSSGLFQVAIPSEGGFLWGASWRLTTGLLFRLRTGLSYKPLMRYEHINTATDIISVLECFYGTLKIKRFPMPFKHLSFYTYIEASDALTDHAKAYLSEDCRN